MNPWSRGTDFLPISTRRRPTEDWSTLVQLNFRSDRGAVVARSSQVNAPLIEVNISQAPMIAPTSGSFAFAAALFLGQIEPRFLRVIRGAALVYFVCFVEFVNCVILKSPL